MNPWVRNTPRYNHEDANVIIDFFQGLDMFDFGADANGSIWEAVGLPDMDQFAVASENTLSSKNGEATAIKRRSIDVNDDSQPVTKLRKAPRKGRSERLERCDETAFHARLLQEELEKSMHLPPHVRSDLEVLVDHPDISKLDLDASQVTRFRLLYFTIGSCQSLVGFKDMLYMARKLSQIHPRTAGSALLPPERYEEICRLDSQEALCVLLRRYHVVELFKTTQASLFQDRGLIMETPSTRLTGQRAMPGNPANRAQADLTNEVLGMILPGLANGSSNYQKKRRHISQLRRLANILTPWTDAYGFGILALLPSGPNQPDFNLTDSMQVLSATIDVLQTDMCTGCSI
jgi:hypothetical protein